MASIIPFLKQNAFDQKDITAMSMAPEDVCRALHLGGPNRPGIIATRIIVLAERGERSPTGLRDRVLSEANAYDLTEARSTDRTIASATRSRP
jgi:hypothetical protein